MARILTSCFAFLALGAADASAQFTISELLVNPPGTDNGQEGVEIRGAASASLAGHSLVIIEGDGTGAGTVDVVLDLSAWSTGANGLLLIRDAASVVSPAPEAGTSVVVNDFAPDIENGSNTYLLATGTPPAQGSDLDLDNDGTIDVALPAGFTVVDGVSILENDGAANVGYADDFGFELLGPFAGPVPDAHTPDGAVRIYNADGSACGWAGGDVAGTNPGGPYSYQIGFEAFGFGSLTAADATLGSANPTPDADSDGVADGCDGCPDDGAKTAAGLCGCGIPEGCTLGRDVTAISGTAGGSATFSLFAGAAHANRNYYLLGAFSTTPGLQLTPSVLLPLNIDFYFNLVLNNPNSPILNPNVGTLDGNGEASCTFFVPPGTSIPSDISIYHAYAVLKPSGAVVFASNEAPVLLQP